jgi:hypothetical protein
MIAVLDFIRNISSGFSYHNKIIENCFNNGFIILKVFKGYVGCTLLNSSDGL